MRCRRCWGWSFLLHVGAALALQSSVAPPGNGTAQLRPPARRCSGRSVPSAASLASRQGGGGDAADSIWWAWEEDTVHVCFCTDLRDIRPLTVAIRSSLANAGDPGRVIYHVIAGPNETAEFARLRRALPQAQIEFHTNASLLDHIRSYVTWRDSVVRRELESPFNFCAYYLPEFLTSADSRSARGSLPAPRRLIYADTDVLFLGDVVQLYGTNLHGQALAAVEDCGMRFNDTLAFEALKQFGALGVRPDDCVFNRGLFLVDVARWRELSITADVERWMQRYHDSREDLWVRGLSQPPWLLAIDGRYQRLDGSWNCRGLGRPWMSAKTVEAALRGRALSLEDLQALGVRAVAATRLYGALYGPYVAGCSEAAKLLHFNGVDKPWHSESKGLPSLCSKPLGFVEPMPEIRTKNSTFVHCRDLWRSCLD